VSLRRAFVVVVAGVLFSLADSRLPPPRVLDC